MSDEKNNQELDELAVMVKQSKEQLAEKIKKEASTERRQAKPASESELPTEYELRESARSRAAKRNVKRPAEGRKEDGSEATVRKKPAGTGARAAGERQGSPVVRNAASGSNAAPGRSANGRSAASGNGSRPVTASEPGNRNGSGRNGGNGKNGGSGRNGGRNGGPEKESNAFYTVFFVLMIVALFALVVFLIKNVILGKGGDDNGKKFAEATYTPTPTITLTPTPVPDTPTPTPTPEPDDGRPKYKIPQFKMTDSTVVLPMTGDDENGGADGSGLTSPIGIALTPFPDCGKPYNPEVDEYLKTQYMVSQYMVLVDLDTGEIVAERGHEEVINPASMTKVLTVLVAMDYIKDEDLDKTIRVSQDTLNYCWKNDCSSVGFVLNQEVCIKDLIYGTIVCSGADAAIELAKYVAGDVDSFVELMNKRCEELGLSENAHFTNPIGIYDDNLHCTVTDIATVMACAVQNEVLQDVLKTRIYNLNTLGQENVVQQISNMFIRRIEDRDTNGTVKGAKTGYVSKAGSCAVSYLETTSGKHYICCTGKSSSAWRCVYDHCAVYRCYTK